MKHAYLIMAHNDFNILEKLIKQIDMEYNDIYIHIDKKVKHFDFDYYKKIVKKSKIYFTDRIDVKWASSKQIECEYILFKAAYKNHYDYYHLLSGSDLLLTDPRTINDFFEKNKGKEFILFDTHDKDSAVKGNKQLKHFNALDRISYYHFLVGWARSKNKVLRKLFGIIHFRTLKLQKKFNINRVKNSDLVFKKGANWVSITDDLVGYILTKEKEMMKIFKHSYCADELFVQTIVYNSDFYKKLYSYNDDDYIGNKRFVDWKRGEPYTFRKEDYDLLISSNCFFARKFSTKIDSDIINMIYNHVMEEKDAKS